MSIVRNLTHCIDGVDTVLKVEFEEPKLADCDWLCICNISGKLINKTIKFYGIDAYQAFNHTSNIAFVWLKSTSFYKNGDIFFENAMDGDIDR